MNRKLILKVILTLLLLFFVISMFNNFVYAGEGGGNFDLGVFETGGTTGGITDTADTILGAILSVMRIVCLGIAIIMITVLAMKYMMAAPGDRAEIKKSAVQYVIGAVIMFGAAAILGLLVEFTNGIFEE